MKRQKRVGWERLIRRCESMKEVFALGPVNPQEQSPLARSEALAAAVVDFGIAGYITEAIRYSKEIIPLAEFAIMSNDSHIYARVGGDSHFSRYVAHRTLSLAFWVLGSEERYGHLRQAQEFLHGYRTAGVSEFEALSASLRIFLLELRLRIQDGITDLSKLPEALQIGDETGIRSLYAVEAQTRSLLMSSAKDARERSAMSLEVYLCENIDPAHPEGPYLGELQRVDLALLSECVCCLRRQVGDAIQVFSFMRGLPGHS